MKKKKENRQTSYFTLLTGYTVFTIILITETILFDWEKLMIFLLLAGLVVGWGVHIYGKMPDAVKGWLYFAIMMMAYLLYGKHASSFFDLAPVMLGIIIIYLAAGLYGMIYPCVIVYFAVLAYDILFVLNGAVEFSALNIVRLVLHCLLVAAAGRMTKFVVEKRAREMSETREKIASLEETNRRIEDFLTNVSHELRTPINAVTGLTAVMLKNEDDAGKRENIFSIQKAGHRLFRQIEDILDYTEIDTGTIAVSEDTYMLSSLLNDIIVENNLMEGEKEIELIFDVDARIPSMLMGDGKKIKKIIKHLLDNAIKFTDEGGVYIRVYALEKPYGINLCICVEDTGIGMDEKSLEKITERFYQSNSGRSRRIGGLGLGIPIVYGMVAAMEGFVHVESSVGNGTTVVVSIPQKVADEAPGMTVESPDQLCLGCYLKPDKYKIPEVRKFYDEMISHIACGLDVAVHRVFTADELETLTQMYQLTHLFLGREEYEADCSRIEGLPEEIQVVVVADSDFRPSEGSRVKVLVKPFYCFPVVNILNSVRTEEGESLPGRRMVCPDVRVLVVDDEPMNRMVAEGIFRDYQMKVKTAGSGSEAIRICEEEDFDLLFLDHMMPEMDGVETLRQIRRIRPDTEHLFTAIAFTANAISGAREMFLREGFDEFLSKPIEDLELQRVLRKVLPRTQIQYVDERTAPETGADSLPKGSGSSETSSDSPSDSPETSADRPEVGETVTAESRRAADDATEDRMGRLREAGINVSSGLTYCRNDELFYLQLLEKFVSDSEEKAESINTLYGESEYENYCIQVHALKSTAKMIGADALSEDARRMEEAAKGEDREYIEANHAALLAEYSEITEKIREAAGFQPEGEDTGGGSGTEISDEEFLASLNELKQSLDTFEPDRAQKCLAELAGTVCRGEPAAELLREIRKGVEDFEFEAASEKVVELIGRWEGGVADED